MNTNETPIEKLLERAEDYGKTTIELVKLNAIDKTSEVVSSLVSRLTVLLIVALFTFIINIGLSLWIGDLLGKSYYGFFVIAGFYALIAIVIYIYRDNWIKNPVRDSVISQMLKTKTV